MQVTTLDLRFGGLAGGIASYLVRHADGALLIESGPGSTVDRLRRALEEQGFAPADVTDVFLTHIHLDHAGAAGWLADQGARIHVHPLGAPHMLDPAKLIASATRIYGDRMDELWGEFLPVPQDRLTIRRDGEVVEVGGVRVHAVDTPGHASHHLTYLIGDTAFVGDVGGVRLGGTRYLRLPMPPPEFNLEAWRTSVDRLREEFGRAGIRRVAPTHFGIYDDPDWHLSALTLGLDEVEEWMHTVMPSNPVIEELRRDFIAWTDAAAANLGVDEALFPVQESVNPAFMSADGIQRYWNRTRANASAGPRQ